MENYAFMNYAHQDKALVSEFADALQNKRVNLWFNADIEECGDHWDNLILEVFKNSSVVFAFISVAYIESVYCTTELEMAIEGGKTIIPVMLEKDVKLPEELEAKLNQSKHLAPYECTNGYVYHLVDVICKEDVIKEISTDSYCSSGFGPKRRIYTKDELIVKPMFNSVKNHPKFGNLERFLRVKTPGSETFDPCMRLFLKPDQEYEFEVLVLNNAAYDLNQTGVGIANSVRASIKLPDMVRPSKIGEVVALIGSTTAQPNAVWDSITLCCDRPIFIKFVPASGLFVRDRDSKTRVLATSLFSNEGVYITDFHKSGTVPSVPAGDPFAGRIVFKIRTSEDCARIEYKKTILSADGGHPVSNIKVGEEFMVKTEFTNAGDIDIRNTWFYDSFPEGMELIPDTTVMTNGANPDGLKMNDIIDKDGFNTGLYGPGAKCTIVYKARFTSGLGVKTIKGSLDHRAGFYSFDTQVNVVE